MTAQIRVEKKSNLFFMCVLMIVVNLQINLWLCKNYWLLCISTSKCMLAHAFAWSKTMKNIQKPWKSTFSIMHTRGSCKDHEEKRRKKFVGQPLGMTPKSWLTPKSWTKFQMSNQHWGRGVEGGCWMSIPCYAPPSVKNSYVLESFLLGKAD